MNMRITLLGTGNPTPSLRRVGSGYLVEIADDLIVLDHGPGAHQRLLESGTKVTDVTHMMFSHLHFDHYLDFPRLFMTRWDQSASLIPELKVFGPSPTAEMVDRLFGENGAFAWDIEARCNWGASLNVHKMRGGSIPRKKPAPVVQEFDHGDVIETDNWRLSIAEVPHSQPYLKCLAMRFDTDEGSLVYSGDTGPSKALEELALGCDVLIHCATNISGTVMDPAHLAGSAGHIEAAQAAANSGAKTLVTTHMYNQLDLPGIRERVIAEMAQVFDGVIVMGEDLMQLGLTPNEPVKFD